jgi:hypothetical protein
MEKWFNILPPSTEITLVGPTKRMTFLDCACLFLMALPVVAIVIGLGGSHGIFFLFPVGLATLLPIGTIVFITQLLKQRIAKQQFSVLSTLVLIFSLTVICMGILGWMLIFVVTNN